MKIKATLSILFSFSFTLLVGQPYLMDGSTNLITTCGSFLLDSGAGDQPYSPNENFEMTICADGSEGTWGRRSWLCGGFFLELLPHLLGGNHLQVKGFLTGQDLL